MTVLFVGDEPSKKNLYPDVAFAGTKSFDTLVGWATKKLNLALYQFTMVNSVSTQDWARIGFHWGVGSPIIALGIKAEKRLRKMGISCYPLPHPSGRNRKLNNKEYVDSELQKCYLWLKEHKCAVSAMTGNLKK
jgi:hypothetical protein